MSQRISTHRSRSLAIPHLASTASSFVTVSIGVAAARCVPGMTSAEWIEHADRQLYKSESDGRNRVSGDLFGGRAVRKMVEVPRRMCA